VLYPVKQLDNFQETDTVTSLYSHLQHTRTRLLSHWLASVRYQLPTVSPFKIPPLLPITNGSEYTLTD